MTGTSSYSRAALAASMAAKSLRDFPDDMLVVERALESMSNSFADVKLPSSPLALSREEARVFAAAAAAEMVEVFDAAALEFLEEEPTDAQRDAVSAVVDPLWLEIAAIYWDTLSSVESAKLERAQALTLRIVMSMYMMHVLPLDLSPLDAMGHIEGLLESPDNPAYRTFEAHAADAHLGIHHMREALRLLAHPVDGN